MITYKVEQSLEDFPFWGQAKDTAERLTSYQLRQIEAVIEDVYCDDYPSDVTINDLFAYDDDFIFGTCLNWKQNKNGEYIDPDDLPEADDEIDYNRIFDLIKFAGHSETEIADPIADIAETIAEEAEEASEIGAGVEIPTIEEFIDLLECFQAGYDVEEISEEEYPCLQLPSTAGNLRHATGIIEEMDLEAMRELIED